MYAGLIVFHLAVSVFTKSSMKVSFGYWNSSSSNTGAKPTQTQSRAFLASFLPGGEHSFPRLARAVLMLRCFRVPVIKYFRNCQVPGSAWAERHTRSGTFCVEPLGQAGRWDGKRAQFKEPKAVSALPKAQCQGTRGCQRWEGVEMKGWMQGHSGWGTIFLLAPSHYRKTFTESGKIRVFQLVESETKPGGGWDACDTEVCLFLPLRWFPEEIGDVGLPWWPSG